MRWSRTFLRNHDPVQGRIAEIDQVCQRAVGKVGEERRIDRQTAGDDPGPRALRD